MAEEIFTAQAMAEGGRNGHVTSKNGVIDLNLKMPKPGESETGATNPEQLFAAGYSACFDGALNLMASRAKKEISSTTEAEVSLLKDSEDDGFKIGVKLNVSIKGVSQTEAEELVAKAHQFCPYSKATQGNINVDLSVVAE